MSCMEFVDTLRAVSDILRPIGPVVHFNELDVKADRDPKDSLKVLAQGFWYKMVKGLRPDVGPISRCLGYNIPSRLLSKISLGLYHIPQS